ncbi:hypothetical protein N7460_004182 [Penicillium canescens]|uniref:Uncharacterized protein n=1 Tax=Penicillium canescens TaxID=5083 RepID=A0AAD6NBE6_PENCN|nr:hypothetical protein N7460_004182 [Penicillium canescens]
MATLPVTLPVNPEFGSRERIGDHLAIMRKFKRILEDAERPGRHAHRFPPPPPGVSGQEQEGKWRVQCLLMSAEVRYSRDVAIIFYAHLLSPFKFQSDIVSSFWMLWWKAEIEFPLARMCAINTDNASKLAWMYQYPNIPYQTVEFTPTGDHAYITAENVMDIHGYRCGSKHCKKKAYVIPMTEWSKYRVGRAKLTCPGCKTTFTNRETKPETLHEFSRAMFGFPVFNLWDSPQRQFGKQGLVDRILALTQVQSLIPVQGLIPDHTSRYIKFLQLIKESKCTLVPTLDIDLLWHTHQLSPVAYDKYCKTQVGRQVDHVDTIRTAKRSTGEDDTARLWAVRYGEFYFDPENTAKNIEIKQRKGRCKQKREAMEAKLAAYDYNHQYIKKALDEASDRLATKHASIRDTHTAVSALNAAVANVETAKESVKPTLRLLELRYYRRSRRQQLRELEDKRRSLVEEYIHKRCEVEALEYEVAREQKPDYKEWEEAKKARRLLEQRLAAEVTLATEAIWQQQQQYQEDRYDGSWCSIVPSEVQPSTQGILGEEEEKKEEEKEEEEKEEGAVEEKGAVEEEGPAGEVAAAAAADAAEEEEDAAVDAAVANPGIPIA